ncbi:Hypothetical_protein [Hexamita inflata]|uniref:Hypothetical_protein n=1 Tax=Hexamita inflata TaxID=28002 RepID=A0AA86U528_9EUKA|nr:Hypothetical protein HINF_LOCUS25877 [Hexamita inflata]
MITELNFQSCWKRTKFGTQTKHSLSRQRKSYSSASKTKERNCSEWPRTEIDFQNGVCLNTQRESISNKREKHSSTDSKYYAGSQTNSRNFLKFQLSESLQLIIVWSGLNSQINDINLIMRKYSNSILLQLITVSETRYQQ